MEAFVDFFKMWVGDVSVDLSGADIGVAKHGLDRANVGAVHEEIGSEAMTESVRGNVFSDASSTGVFFDDTFDRTGGEAAEIARGINFALMAAIIEKKWGESVFSFVEVSRDPVSGGRGDKNRAILAAFTTDDKFAAVKIDRITIEFNEFGNTKPAGEK